MLLYPEQLDRRFNWPPGRAKRLARRRELPHVLLPDGSIRFESEAIERLIGRVDANPPLEVSGELSDEGIDAIAGLLLAAPEDDDRNGGSQCTLCSVNQAVAFGVSIPNWDTPIDVCRSCLESRGRGHA